MHGGADPGRSGRPRARRRPAHSGDPAGAAGLPEEGELGRLRDLLPDRARARPAAPASDDRPARAPRSRDRAATCLGPTALGFRHRDDVREITGLLEQLGVAVNVVAPLGASPADIARLGDADFNVVLYPEIASQVASWLEKALHQPAVQDRADRRSRDASLRRRSRRADRPRSQRQRWPARRRARPGIRSRSNSTYLTGKRVFIFGDATHAARGRSGRHARSLASRSSGSAPTAASSPARCGRPPRSSASRR